MIDGTDFQNEGLFVNPRQTSNNPPPFFPLCSHSPLVLAIISSFLSVVLSARGDVCGVHATTHGMEMKPCDRRLHRAEWAEAGERQPDRAAADGVHYAESFRQEGHRRYPVECRAVLYCTVALRFFFFGGVMLFSVVLLCVLSLLFVRSYVCTSNCIA